MTNNTQAGRLTSSKPRISLMVQDSSSIRRRYSCPSGLHLYRSVSMPKSEESNDLEMESDASSSACSSESCTNEDMKLLKKERVQKGSIPLMGSLVYFKKRGESFPQTADDAELHSEIMKITEMLGKYKIKNRSGDTMNNGSIKHGTVSDPLVDDSSISSTENSMELEKFPPLEEDCCPLCDFTEIDDRLNEERRHSTEWMENNLHSSSSSEREEQRDDKDQVHEPMNRNIHNQSPNHNHNHNHNHTKQHIQHGSKSKHRHHHHGHLDKCSGTYPERATSAPSLHQTVPYPAERSAGYRNSRDSDCTLGTSGNSRISSSQSQKLPGKRHREHKRRLTCAVIFTQPRVVEI